MRQVRRDHHHPAHLSELNWTPSRRGRGLEVLAQVVLAVVVLTAGLAVGAGHYGAQHLKVEESRRLARAEDLFGQTLRAIAAYSYEEVSLMNGSSFQDGATEETSAFTVELAVTEASSDFLKVDAVLFDKNTHKEIRRFVTYRGRG